MKIFLKVYLVFIFLFSISFVLAFGVSLPYTMQRPLEISPGETKVFDLNLQNMIGNENYIVKVEIVEGNQIASFVEEKEFYEVQLGVEDFLIPIEVAIPKKELVGDQKEISFKISRMTESTNDGMVVLEGGMTVKMAVKVISDSKEDLENGEIFRLIWIISSLVFLILLFILITLVLRTKRKLKIRYKVHKRS